MHKKTPSGDFDFPGVVRPRVNLFPIQRPTVKKKKSEFYLFYEKNLSSICNTIQIFLPQLSENIVTKDKNIHVFYHTSCFGYHSCQPSCNL